jgi:hypothetical protein
MSRSESEQKKKTENANLVATMSYVTDYEHKVRRLLWLWAYCYDNKVRHQITTICKQKDHQINVLISRRTRNNLRLYVPQNSECTTEILILCSATRSSLFKITWLECLHRRLLEILTVSLKSTRYTSHLDTSNMLIPCVLHSQNTTLPRLGHIVTGRQRFGGRNLTGTRNTPPRSG